MTINDAKKVMLDKVNLEIEFVELSKEIRAKEKQIKGLESDVQDAEYSYSQLENSGIKQFFLAIGFILKRILNVFFYLDFF